MINASAKQYATEVPALFMDYLNLLTPTATSMIDSRSNVTADITKP